MASEDLKPHSRRALLTAAAGAAGAFAATAAMPFAATAADPNDIVKEVDNPTIATTSVTQSTPGQVAFKAHTTSDIAAGLLGSAGDETNMSLNTSFSGIYGWSPSGGATDAGTGVWGDSDDIGVLGTGSVGVYGYGGTGVIGESASASQPGVLALGAGTNSLALQVVGKVSFSRSGRRSMSSGTRTRAVSLVGVTSTSKVFAVLATSESGRWVRAVVPAAGKFTIYLNTTLTSSAVVSWFVLD